MGEDKKRGQQLTALRAHLAERRSAILAAWRNAVKADPKLTTAASLPRRQFYDHIPHLLDVYIRKLEIDVPATDVNGLQRENAAAHGLLRWQQGYDLREVTQEWGCLQACLADELESYAAKRAELDPAVISLAWKCLGELCAEGIRESTAQYFALHRAEAAGQVKDLEAALDGLRRLESEQGEVLRHATHDLRGNLAVVANAADGLTRVDVPDPIRHIFLDVLQKNVISLHALLDDLTMLSRLRAGQERVRIDSFDAGALLIDICGGLRSFARDHGLFLKTEGPRSLTVEGDSNKVRRIAQNLLLNALKYTERGGVTLAWGDSRQDDPQRWMLCVIDTGPGFHAGPGAPLAAALEEATDEARQIQRTQNIEEPMAATMDPPVPHTRIPDSRAIHQQQGEGIGLSIVKRLCELLDASLEIESVPDRGTVCRVLLPRKLNK